jgi:hypothetical protein
MRVDWCKALSRHLLTMGIGIALQESMRHPNVGHLSLWVLCSCHYLIFRFRHNKLDSNIELLCEVTTLSASDFFLLTGLNSWPAQCVCCSFHMSFIVVSTPGKLHHISLSCVFLAVNPPFAPLYQLSTLISFFSELGHNWIHKRYVDVSYWEVITLSDNSTYDYAGQGLLLLQIVQVDEYESRRNRFGICLSTMIDDWCFLTDTIITMIDDRCFDRHNDDCAGLQTQGQ